MLLFFVLIPATAYVMVRCAARASDACEGIRRPSVSGRPENPFVLVYGHSSTSRSSPEDRWAEHRLPSFLAETDQRSPDLKADPTYPPRLRSCPTRTPDPLYLAPAP
jgi:hypothetical protein